MLVSEVMSRDVVTIKKDTTLKKAAETMMKYGIGSLLVLEGTKLVGLITESDVVKSMAQDKKPEHTLVEDLMAKKLVTVEPDEKLENAVNMMVKNKIKKLPVLENGKIKGILSVTDIAVVEPKLIANIAGLLSMQFPGYRG